MGKVNKKKIAQAEDHSDVEEQDQVNDDDDFQSLPDNESESNTKKRKNAVDEDDSIVSGSKKSRKGASDKKSKAGASNGVKSKEKDLNDVDKKDRKKGGKSASKAANNKKNNDEKSEDEEDEEVEYEVKDVVGVKIENGSKFYLIRWKGYTAEDDTWEPEETLSCHELIAKFEKKHTEVAASKTPKNKTPKPSPLKKKKEKNASPAAAVDPSKEWEVDKIIDYAQDKDGFVYRIRWKGYSAKHDTWEPKANLFCDDLIEKFHKRMKAMENVSFKELREDPKKTKRLVNETQPRTNYHNAIGRSSKRSVTKKRVFYGDSED